MNYCSQCSAKLVWVIPTGDHRSRFSCQSCGFVVYDNPIPLTAVFVCYKESILWIKRGLEPRKGQWAFPGGFMESDPNGMMAKILGLIPVSISSFVDMNQIWITFRCHLDTLPNFIPTAEATRGNWYTIQDAPWCEKAYPETEPQVRQIYRWLGTGEFGIRIGYREQRSGMHYQTYFIK